MILIITNKEDVHPTPVIRLLNERNIPVFRLNTEALLTDYHVCWQCNVENMDFHIKNIHTQLEVRGSDITAVWDRRPEKPSGLLVQNSPQINKHNLAEAEGFLSFLRYYIKDIFSIGSIVNDRPAASKMLQLQIARKVGFRTPDSCFSNRKEDVLKFAEHHENLVLKSIENNYIWDEEKEQEYVFYTRKIESSSLIDVTEEAFSQTVGFVQNYIEKQFELRITVVDNHFFACKIDSQILDDDKGKIDWRQGYDYGLKHEIYDLPQEIKDKCSQFLNHLGLHFGCFDFIFTPSGEYVFLECNPNGQWLWVEIETGMKISEAIAEAGQTHQKKCPFVKYSEGDDRSRF
ncbi:MAG: hypothetical protein FWF09_08575 [Bacteroidales bacterium]|nr:hypothetical protein [Bacteroidales bacterium]